jgi:hypothetical protein
MFWPARAAADGQYVAQASAAVNQHLDLPGHPIGFRKKAAPLAKSEECSLKHLLHGRNKKE